MVLAEEDAVEAAGFGQCGLLGDFVNALVSFLLVAAIVNLLIGVVLRYIVVDITDYFDLDPIPF